MLEGSKWTRGEFHNIQSLEPSSSGVAKSVHLYLKGLPKTQKLEALWKDARQQLLSSEKACYSDDHCLQLSWRLSVSCNQIVSNCYLQALRLGKADPQSPKSLSTTALLHVYLDCT